MKEHADALETTPEGEARKVVERAVAAQKEGKLEEALALYRRKAWVFTRWSAYANTPNASTRSHPKPRLGGDARSRAETIWRQAAELQKAEKYEEAPVKYREGLAIPQRGGGGAHREAGEFHQEGKNRKSLREPDASRQLGRAGVQ